MSDLSYWRNLCAAAAWTLAVLCHLAPEALAQTGRPGTPPAPTERAPSDDRSDTAFRDDRAGLDVAQFRGRPEYAVFGPATAMDIANTQLLAAGAQLLRIRPLPALNGELRIYDFRNRLNLSQARQSLAQAAPETVVDLNAVYRFAQSSAPRLYAASLLGETAGSCRLRSSVTIGMIDGPVHAAHPALSAASVTVLSTLVPGDRAVAADHGTAVAALLVGDDPAGALNGFATGARLVAVSAFANESGSPGADIDRLSGGIDTLVRNGADVINMSFAGPPNTVFDRLLVEAARLGPILIAAAGNTNSNSALYPAAATDVIAVTAVDAALRRFRRASFGTNIEIAAPGVDVFVADGDDGGRYASGTSYAAPIASALIARLTARGVGSANSVRQFLRTNSRDLGTPGRDTETGWGLMAAPAC